MTDTCRECENRSLCEELEYPLTCTNKYECEHYNAFLEGVECNEHE